MRLLRQILEWAWCSVEADISWPGPRSTSGRWSRRLTLSQPEAWMAAVLEWTGSGSGMMRSGSHLELAAQAGAVGTRAVGIVEREHARGQLRHGDAAVLAGVVLGEKSVRLSPSDSLMMTSPPDRLARGLDASRSGGGPDPACMTSRSTTTSMLCFLFLSSVISSRQVVQAAVHAHAGVAAARGRPRTPCACSPFLPRTTGARI